MSRYPTQANRRLEWGTQTLVAGEENSEGSAGCPIQARFWLEWDTVTLNPSLCDAIRGERGSLVHFLGSSENPDMLVSITSAPGQVLPPAARREAAAVQGRNVIAHHRIVLELAFRLCLFLFVLIPQ